MYPRTAEYTFMRALMARIYSLRIPPRVNDKDEVCHKEQGE